VKSTTRLRLVALMFAAPVLVAVGAQLPIASIHLDTHPTLRQLPTVQADLPERERAAHRREQKQEHVCRQHPELNSCRGQQADSRTNGRTNFAGHGDDKSAVLLGLGALVAAAAFGLFAWRRSSAKRKSELPVVGQSAKSPVSALSDGSGFDPQPVADEPVEEESSGFTPKNNSRKESSDNNPAPERLRPSAPLHQRGRRGFIVGEARHVERGTYTVLQAKASVQCQSLSFRLVQSDRADSTREIQVEMRGLTIKGAVQNGDQIEIRERFVRGGDTARPKRVRNLRTSSLVIATSEPMGRLASGFLTLLVLAVLGLIVLIFINNQH